MIDRLPPVSDQKGIEMTTAKEIRNGLDFLLAQVEGNDELIETGAEHDVFYAGLHYPLCSHECTVIETRMVELHWTRVEDDCVLGFRHAT